MPESNGKTILLVEDEVLIAMNEKNALGKHGYAVLMAHSGEEAVETALSVPSIDLILMDIDLGGGMSGTDAARSILEGRDVPVVFMSSHTEPEVVEKTEGITSYGYIVKNSALTARLASIRMAFRLFEARMREREKHESLLVSEKRFRELTDSISDVFFAMDRDLVYTHWNRASEILTGIPASGAIGKSLIVVFPSIAGSEVERRYREVIRTGTAAVFETEYSQDGRQFVFEISCYPSSSGISVFTKDVTERRKAEEAVLEDSARRRREAEAVARIAMSRGLAEGDLRSLAKELTEAAASALDVERTGLWFFEDGGARLVNLDTFVATEGRHASGDVLLESAYRNEFDAFRKSTYVDAADALNDPRTAGYVENYLRPLGITSMLDASVRLEGRTVGVLCIEYVGEKRAWQADEIAFVCQLADQVALALSHRERLDAEKQKEAAHGALRESEERFRLLVRNSSDMTVLVDAEGGELYCSDSVERITGFTTAEIIGRSGLEFIHPVDHAAVLDAAARTMADPSRAVRVTYRHMHKKGGWLTFEAIAQNHMDNPSLKSIVMNVRDVTDRTMYAEKLEAANRELAAINEELNATVEELEATNEEFEATNEELIVSNRRLEEKEREYRTLFESAPLGVFIALGDRFALLNPACEEIIGIPADTLKGGSFLGHIHPDDRNGIVARYLKKLEGEEVENGPFRIVDGKGGTRWVQANSTVIDWEGSRATLNYITDVTVKQKAEEVMRETLEKLRIRDEQFDFMARNMLDMIAYAGPDGKYRYVSPSCMAVLGYSEREIEGLQGFSILHPDDFERVTGLYAEAMGEGRRELRYEALLARADGSYAPFEVLARIMYDANGSLEGFLLTSRDISERKRMEAQKEEALSALRESEEKYRFLAENMGDIIWILDMDLHTHYVSPSVEAVLGFTVEERMRQGVEEQITPGSIALIGEALAAEFDLHSRGLSDPKKVFTFELEFYHRDGSTRLLEVLIKKIIDAGGEWTGFLGVSRDITARRKSEEALRNLQKLESLGVLAGGIAHDFNNLLGGIYGYIGLARAATDEAKILGYLDESMATIERARALTNQLLTFSKGGEPVLMPESLGPLIREVAQFSLSGSTVSHAIEIEDDTWPCLIDRNQIGQVFGNLIMNARQAMPAGGDAEITARNVVREGGGDSVSKTGRYVEIAVRDRGEGIPGDILPRIFDPFFTTRAGGHGLGLATCHSVVTRHGGFIEVESLPGKGSTFRVFLPAAEDAPRSRGESPRTGHRGSGRVLIMDDEESIRVTLAKMLAALGYDCVSMKDGSEVMDHLRANSVAEGPFVLVVLDLTVPGGMGGREIVTAVRALLPEVPIVVTSGYADDAVMADPAAHGFSASLGKPFTMDELSSVLERCVRRAPGEGGD